MKRRQILVVVLSLALTVCMSIPANADILSTSKVSETIDAKLQNVLQDSASNEKIPVDIWLYETSTQEEREQAIFSKIGMNRASILATKDSVSAKEVDEYIVTERSLYAAERAEQYAEMKQAYANIEGLQETRETDTRLFYSQYAPMISAELTRADIKKLASDRRVQSIEYTPDVKLESHGDVSVPTIGADYVRDTLGYTGSGIKIGLLEVYGLPDESSPYFDADNIIYDHDEVNQQEFDDHAEHVAAIMVAQPKTINGVTYEGIVPDAQLYATYAGSLNAMRGRIEWLLSEGVHVINMSAGSNSDTSYAYGSHEKWFDHIAFNHSVHFVKSAGNSNGYISRPGMAYNIITVGAIDDKNTTSYADDVRCDWGPNSGSSYMEDDSLTNKPDLLAPGVAIDSAASSDGSWGTSWSAPHVTAVVAQLCQRKPELKLLQDAVKAILTASVSHSKIRGNTVGGISDEYDQCGAGVVNARSAFSTIVESRYESGSFAANSGDGTQVMYTFNVTNTKKIVRVSLSWLKCSVFPAGVDHAPEDETADEPVTETGTLANLNLYIYDSAGEILRSNNIGINTEIVEFRPTRTGTHRIYIRQSSDSNKRVYYGLAWWHPMS